MSRALCVVAAVMGILIGVAAGYFYTLHASRIPRSQWFSVGAGSRYPKTHLKVIGAWGSLTQYRNFERPFWESRIRDRSKGGITADIAPFNDAGIKANDVLGLLKVGAIDFGSVVLGYLAADDARNEAADLAGLAPDALIARKVVEAYKPIYEKLYREKYGVKVLGIWPYSAQVLFCNVPISSLTDLKGKRVRTASRSMADFVEGLGGTAIALSFNEVVPALRQENLDCAITGALSGNSAKWQEVTTHLHMLPLGWSLVMHGASLKTWVHLDPNVREFIASQLVGLEDDIWRAASAETQQGFDCNAGKDSCTVGTKGNLTLVDVDASEKVIRRNTLIDAVLPQWATRCMQCISDWNASIGEIVGIKIESPAQ